MIVDLLNILVRTLEQRDVALQEVAGPGIGNMLGLTLLVVCVEPIDIPSLEIGVE